MISKKCYRLREDGLTLVEVLAASVIIVVAAIGVYIGILYAEAQLNRNYHDRVATLLASGECDWQYYRKVYHDAFDEFLPREVVIDEFEGSAKHQPLRGMMSMELYENVEVVFGRTMRYKELSVQIEWDEPLAGKRVMLVREDVFR